MVCFSNSYSLTVVCINFSYDFSSLRCIMGHSNCPSGVLRSQNLMISNSWWHTNSERGFAFFTNISKEVTLGTLGPSQKTDKEEQESTYEGNDSWSVISLLESIPLSTLPSEFQAWDVSPLELQYQLLSTWENKDNIKFRASLTDINSGSWGSQLEFQIVLPLSGCVPGFSLPLKTFRVIISRSLCWKWFFFLAVLKDAVFSEPFAGCFFLMSQGYWAGLFLV